MPRALVIDDSRAMRSLLSRLLTGLGFDATGAEHGRAGLDVLESDGPFDVALVDWNMPVMDGLTFIRTVRSDRRWDRVKLLVVTSEGSPRNVYEAMKAGADEYAIKPVTADAVASKMTLMGVPLPVATGADA